MTTMWSSALRRLVPSKVKSSISRRNVKIEYRSTSLNIYHCCVPKAGSQWIKAILSDPRIYMYSGLLPYTYQRTLPGLVDPRKLTDRSFLKPFPRKTVITPLYIDFKNFLALPKPERYKAFFVMRDPRDLVISTYFSQRYSHVPMGNIPKVRELLEGMSQKDGIRYMIRFLEDFGIYEALRSWVNSSKSDDNVLLIRFEDLIINDNLEIFKRLFSHTDIRIPEEVLCQLLQDYSFERLSGRRQGEEDKYAHYRKGSPGDWKTYFDSTIVAEFKEVTGDLVIHLGYEKGPDWGFS